MESGHAPNNMKENVWCNNAAIKHEVRSSIWPMQFYELRKIEFGTRLCLAFNLVKRSPLEPSSKGSMSDRLEKVEVILELSLKEATAKRLTAPSAKLVIPLEHKYTKQNLSFAGLKGDDIILKELLKECREKNKNQLLDLHLCIVSKHVAQITTSSGSCCSEEAEQDFEFGNWMALDDKPVPFDGLKLDMEKEVLGEEGELFDSEPDEEDFEPVGNRGGRGNASAGYSATGTPHGLAGEAFCVIEKTRRLFDFSLDDWQKEQKVIERLRFELEKLRSAVPDSNSVALPAFPVGSDQPDSKRQRLDTDVTEDTMEMAEGSKI